MEKHGRREFDGDNATRLKSELWVEKLLLPVFLLALIKTEREIPFKQTYQACTKMSDT